MNLTERLHDATSRMMDAASQEEARIARTLPLGCFCSKECRLRFASDIRYHLVAGVINDPDNTACEYCDGEINPNREDPDPDGVELFPEVFEEEPDEGFDNAP